MYANPGRRVVCVAEVVLEGDDPHVAVDVQTGKPLTLSELLRAFREDPSEADLGWVKVTIEPGRR